MRTYFRLGYHLRELPAPGGHVHLLVAQVLQGGGRRAAAAVHVVASQGHALHDVVLSDVVAAGVLVLHLVLVEVVQLSRDVLVVGVVVGHVCNAIYIYIIRHNIFSCGEL